MGCSGSKTAEKPLQQTTADGATSRTLLPPGGEKPAMQGETWRVFAPASAKGGCTIDATKAALVCIEYQNEFASECGRLHDGVKEVMQQTDMLKKSANVAQLAREIGMKVIMVPISFKKDGSDNPNKGLGILKDCDSSELFLEDTWSAEFCDAMKPQEGDLVVKGKKGLDAFPGTDLEELLVKNGIETVVLCGFLTNCCVESTMRTAYEKGFNVVTLTDCCATNSVNGQRVAVEGTFGMFSKPMIAAEFIQAVAPQQRVFSPADAKGGCTIVPEKAALVCIEFQNEFTSAGGKLHDGVTEVMQQTGMLERSANVAQMARETGMKVIMVPISFKKDGSDNPNKGLGILAGCNAGELFLEGSWNAEFCDAMKPKEGDLIVQGKKGLDAFMGTDLAQLLVKNGIETVALCGFLTNCCVESTMRTACEKGFNVVTLTDCCATNSVNGQRVAVEGTFGMFSKPMTADDFMKELRPETTVDTLENIEEPLSTPEVVDGDQQNESSERPVKMEEVRKDKTSWCC